MIAALLFLILFALLFPKALKFLLFLMFIGAMVVFGEVHAKPDQTTESQLAKAYQRDAALDHPPYTIKTDQPTPSQILMEYQRTKARCTQYGGGAPIHYKAGERGERDCEDLGYTIETLQDYGCHVNKHEKWECPRW
jgi:hypothetical protein